jgi:hypothetical protein
VTPLIDVREDDTFLDDQRDVKAALIAARRFATDKPFKDRQEAGEAADAIGGLKAIFDATEDHRKELTAPWRLSTEHVNSHYKELTAPAKAAIEALKRKTLAFQQAERARVAREQREEQERLDREAEQKAEEAQAAAELAAEEPDSSEAKQLHAEAHQEAARAAVAQAPAVAPPKQVRGSFGKLGLRTEYRHSVSDVSALPDEFKIANDKAIKAAIKGERAMAKAQGRAFNLDLIPGVQITPEEIPVGGGA